MRVKQQFEHLNEAKLLKLNIFWKRKVLDTRLLWPNNFSRRDQVDYLTVEYFESSWNLENMELECGPAQPDLLYIYF